jgi:hypothetical protein
VRAGSHRRASFSRGGVAGFIQAYAIVEEAGAKRSRSPGLLVHNIESTELPRIPFPRTWVNRARTRAKLLSAMTRRMGKSDPVHVPSGDEPPRQP